MDTRSLIDSCFDEKMSPAAAQKSTEKTLNGSQKPNDQTWHW
jgi:hypothetical protein